MSRQRLLSAGAILLLPFVICWWLVPIAGHGTIGNDYVVHSIQNQLELQLALRHGMFPLFVPGFAAGSSASALTLGQLYHPLPHLAALLPGYWEGRALDWNTWLRLLSLGVTHLALFALLLRLRLRTAIAFGVSLVTVYNLRMLDQFRYGAGLEGYTASLLLGASLMWCGLAPTRRGGAACIVISTYLLVVSGHPQMSYYGLLGAGLVWLLTPFVMPHLAADAAACPRPRRFYLATGVWCGAGVALASAYTFPFVFDFLVENGGRAAQTYAWSTNLQDSWGGLVNNFWRPFSSDVHGAFGGSFLPLLAVLAPPALWRARRAPTVMWIVLALVCIVLLYSLGSATPVHRLAWNGLPFQSSMRVPGRATVLLPLLLMWLLAWAWREDDDAAARQARAWLALGIAATVILVPWLVSGQLPAPGPFRPAAIRAIPSWADTVVLWSGVASLLALAVRAPVRRVRVIADGVFAVALVVQAAVTTGFGTWTTERAPTPSIAQLQQVRERTLTYPFPFGWGMYPASVVEHLHHTFFAPDVARLYRSALLVDSRDAAYASLERDRQADRVVIEDATGVAPPPGAVEGPSATQRVELDHSGFNRLSFTVTSDTPAFFVVAFPFSGRWNANVDGQPARVYRANGNENAVRVPLGERHVELRYWSRAAAVGEALSLLTLLVLLVLLATLLPRPWMRCAAAAAGLGLVVMLGAAWRTHLYAGTGLGTRYSWGSSPPDPRPNLAFGRATLASSVRSPENFHLLDSSRAVDGARFGEGAFVTDREVGPWWQVDLGAVKQVESIVLYEGTRTRGGLPAFLPLTVSVAERRGDERIVRVVQEPSDNGRWSIDLAESVQGRYVTLASGADAVLNLSEVEVYGPPD